MDLDGCISSSSVFSLQGGSSGSNIDTDSDETDPDKEDETEEESD